MSLNIGTLVGYLQLDDSNFNRKADAADRKLQALKLNLEALDKSDPKVKIQVDAQAEKIDALRARIEDLKAKAAEGINVKVEMTQAMLDLEAVQIKVRQLTNDEVKVKVGTTGTAKTLAELEAVKKKADEANQSTFGIGAAIVGLGPMALPFLTATSGGLFAIGSGALAAASGVGVLKFAMSGLAQSGSAYQSYQTALQQADNTYNFAVAAAARKGGKGYAQALATAAANRQKSDASAQIALNGSAYGNLNPAGQQFVRFAVNTLQPDELALKSTAQGAILPGLTVGLSSVMHDLPYINQMLRDTGGAVGGAIADAGRALNTPYWQDFIKFIGTDSKRDLPILANTFGNLFKGLTTGIERFAPDGTSLLMWFDHLSQKFANWTAGPGFETFIQTVERDAGAVLNFLRSAAPLLGAMFSGLDSAGVAELNVVTLALKALSILPTQTFQVLGAVLPGIVLAIKGMSALGGLQGLGNGLALIGSMSETVGSTSLGTLGSGLANASKRLGESKVAAGAFGAGLAGLMLTATQTSGAMTVFGDAASGALLGFSVGGAFGAAIGGVAGALGGLLTTALHHSSQAFDNARSAAANYGSTLDRVTGAITDATRAQALQNIGATNIRTATSLGISPTVLANAALGNTADQNLIRSAAGRGFQALKNSGADATTLGKFVQSYAALGAAIGGSNAGLQDQETLLKATNELQWKSLEGTNAYAKALKGLPGSVQTQISALNLKPTTKAVIDLAAQYAATPKAVQTYLQALGTDLSISKIQHLLDVAAQADRTHTLTVKADTSGATRAIQNLIGIFPTATSFSPFGVPGKPAHKAFGGLISGIGTATSDSIPAMLSNGEFVVNAAAAARNLPLLQAINSQHYAWGGEVSASHVRAAGASSRAVVRSYNEGAAHGGPLPVVVVNHRQIADAVDEISTNASLNTLDFHGEGY